MNSVLYCKSFLKQILNFHFNFMQSPSYNEPTGTKTKSPLVTSSDRQ